MALLARSFSFRSFAKTNPKGSPLTAYLSSRTFASRRSTNRIPATIINNDEDTTTTDEDEEFRENLDIVQVDNTIRDVNIRNINDVMCRVHFPTNRRAWATSQDENALSFRMDMPGIAKEDVKVYVDDNRLVVRGKYNQPKEIAEDESHILAENVGTYSAELFLPDNVQSDKIKSQMKDGMLVVTAPKQVTNVVVE
ncbi:hypothetical protein KP509_35G059100 [Ceratopteris richardii]|nr:hypothetical protein KP509_35G059100 [Ceratopteris richardii]